MSPDQLLVPERPLLVGVGRTGCAVALALVERGVDVVAVDDAPADTTRALLGDLGVQLVEAPTPDRYRTLLAGT